MNEMGNKIAQKRKDLGMTQIEFADQMHVTRQTVSRWEAGTETILTIYFSSEFSRMAGQQQTPS
jgi:transcriptional regulator with XRE-family HTH domain